jgi:GDP-L-fucose synthase
MSFKNKKVLVAGGTGMIGIPLVDMLISQGARIRVASLDDPSRSHPEAEFVRTDLMSFENCLAVCRGMEFVFNLLGVKGSPAVTTTRPASFLYPTTMMQMNLLEAARLSNVEGYLLTSSIGVYGPAEIFREDDVWSNFPSSNDWFSGWAKRFGELQVEAYKIEYGWNRIAVVRPANVYGPHDNFDSQNAMVVPSLIKRALAGQNPLVVWGDGSAVRDFIHARDVARGMLLVAEKMPPAPVNIGSGIGTSIKELVECVISNLEKKPSVIWDRSKPSGDNRRVMDISRLLDLGFEFELSLAQGIQEAMTWYREYQEEARRRYDVFNRSAPGSP